MLPSMDSELITGYAIALGLGLLVGFQRERVKSPLAGIRTFALIALGGAAAAHLGLVMGMGWILPAAIAVLGALLVSGHAARARTEDPELTTEVAAIVVALVGALAIAGPHQAAVTAGAVVALLLHFKPQMHETVRRMADAEVRAVMTLVLIALLVLPLLPDRPIDPLGVLNPHDAWRMVVLIVGVGVIGYASYRIFGTKGAWLSGLVGGLISSTATTLQQARGSKAKAGADVVCALVIVVASATALVRVLVEMAVVSRALFVAAAAPVLVVAAALAAVALALWWRGRGIEAAELQPENPAQLKTALVFGVLYAVVIVAVAWSRRMFGDSGLTVVAVLSGLTDVDAITLSTSRLVEQGGIGADEGWRLVLIAALSNLGFKGALAAVVGSRRLGVLVAGAVALALAVGIPLVLAWPRPS